MPDLRTYDIGTVAVTAAGAVTVTTGIWSDANVQPGDSISIDGGPALLIRSKSDTSHAQIVGWDGGDVSGKSYEVFQDASYRFDDVELALDLKDQVTALNKINYFIPVQDDEAAPDPSLGDESQRAFKDLTGQWWKKESGVWNLKNSPYGMQAAQALAEIAALGGAKQVAALTNLGGTSVGRAVFAAANVAAARTALGATAMGSSVFTAADGPAVWTAIGASSTGTIIKFPNNITLMRGAASVPSGGYGTITFPTAFPNGCLAVFATVAAAVAANYTYQVDAINPTKTNFYVTGHSIQNGGALALDTPVFNWLAWGY